jgi:hypothetical protein
MTLLRVEGLSLDIHGLPILRDVGFAVQGARSSGSWARAGRASR